MHYVYKVTNLVNGKYYIGKRKHRNPPKDGYMGSGKQIIAAIQKYGKENFSKEILEIVASDQEAAEIEARLVPPSILDDPLCYNMRRGGFGGWEHINRDPRRLNHEAIRRKVRDGTFIGGGCRGDSHKKAASIQAVKNREVFQKASREYWSSEEAKISASERAKANNPMKGKSWYTDGVNNFCLSPTDAASRKGLRKGRVMGLPRFRRASE